MAMELVKQWALLTMVLFVFFLFLSLSMYLGIEGGKWVKETLGQTAFFIYVVFTVSSIVSFCGLVLCYAIQEDTRRIHE